MQTLIHMIVPAKFVENQKNGNNQINIVVHEVEFWGASVQLVEATGVIVPKILQSQSFRTC